MCRHNADVIHRHESSILRVHRSVLKFHTGKLRIVGAGLNPALTNRNWYEYSALLSDGAHPNGKFHGARPGIVVVQLDVAGGIRRHITAG